MSTKVNYRPDIDGLRAAAVIGVLLFHINHNILPGGFVGVDVFFVISGYLITQIIQKELSQDIFSFKEFYARRIKRILPVFIVVVAFTVMAGKIILIDEDWVTLANSARYAIFFLANIYFSKEKGYFDLEAYEKPLLHLWSLSVEEQYYIFWPILFVLIFKVNNLLFQRQKHYRLFSIIVVFLAIIVGFLTSQAALNDPKTSAAAYFFLHTRYGELLIGAFTALLPAWRNSKALNLLGMLGVIGIFYSFFNITGAHAFPGYNALFPCVAAALLLYSGATSATVASRLLSFPALVYIGLLSYSLYLWHWPILAYMRYLQGQYNLPLNWVVVALVLTFVFSFFTYNFVEKKENWLHMSFRAAAIKIYIIPSILLLACCIAGSKYWFGPALPQDLLTYGHETCHGNFEKNCIRGSPGVAPTVLVFGDSHAAALNSFMDVVGAKEGWSATVVTGSSCSPVFRFDVNVLPEFARQPCVNLKTFVEEHYLDYRAIIIASSWEYQLGLLDIPADKDYLAKFEHTVKTIAKDRPVYVLSDVPRLPISPFRLARFEKLHLNVERSRPREAAEANEVIRGIVSTIPNVHWVDLDSVMQGFGQIGSYEGLPTYFDDEHLNVYGSTKLGEAFAHTRTMLPLSQISSAQPPDVIKGIR